MMRPALRALVLAFALFGLGVSVGSGCTPAQREAVEPAARVACILLRAFTTSGRLDEICATADELAPYVADLLAAREESPEPASSSAPLVLSFSMPPPARRVPRRRCVSWLPVAEARARAREASSSPDGGGAEPPP